MKPQVDSINLDLRPPRGKSPRRRIALATVIVILVSVVGFSTWALTRPPSSPSASAPLTMREFLDLRPSRYPGTTYQIEAAVTKWEFITTPGLSPSGNFTVTVIPSTRMNFTAATFESLPTFTYHFLGNRTGDFPVGSVVGFSVVSQTWDVAGRPMYGFEHDYAVHLLGGYDFAIMRGEYRPFEADTAVANGTLYVNITATTDVYPLPANWKDTYISFHMAGVGVVPAPSNVRLYDAGNLVGTWPGGGGSSLLNGNLDHPFRAGQSLQVPFDGTYSLIQLAAPNTLGNILVP